MPCNTASFNRFLQKPCKPKLQWSEHLLCSSKCERIESAVLLFSSREQEDHVIYSCEIDGAAEIHAKQKVKRCSISSSHLLH